MMPKHPSGATEIGCRPDGRFGFDEQDQRVYPVPINRTPAARHDLRVDAWPSRAEQTFCDPVNGV